MVIISDEGKFNDYSYLIDAMFMKLPKSCAIYVIENDGKRLMIDTGEGLMARKLIKNLKSMDLFPIHSILLSHAHWDHIQALGKIQKLHGDNEIEVFASMNAIDILKDPTETNKFFGYIVDPIEDVIPLKEHDIIDLNGLELKVHEFFGHTMDSIALENPETKNIFVGDAIIDHVEAETYLPVLFGPHFNEEALLKTYRKLRNLKDNFESISLAHFGVWKGEDYERLVDNVEELYFKAKNSLVKWYNEGLSTMEITEKYHDEIVPNSKKFTKGEIMGLHWNVEQHLQTLKKAGFIN